MTEHFACNDCQERLEAFALDELAGGDRDRVAAHLASGCTKCNQRLSEMLETWSLVAQTVPKTVPPASLERKVFARIHSVPAEVRAAAVERAPLRLRNWVAAAAALAAGLACVSLWLDRSSTPSPLAGDWADLDRRILAAEHEQRPLPRAQLKFVTRQGDATAESRVFGHVVEDRLANQCHVFIQNLPPLAADREYRLWFILADGSFRQAGNVRPEADGGVSAILELPAGAERPVALGISSESDVERETPSPDLLQVPI